MRPENIVCVPRAVTARVDRPADIAQLIDVTARTIDDHAGDASILGKASHETADHGCFGIRVGINDDHIAALADLKCLQWILQVAGRELNGEGSADELAGEDRFD